MVVKPVKRKRGRPRKPKKQGPIRGKPPHAVTPRNITVVQTLAASRCTHADICVALDISLPTLYKYYKEYLTKAPVEMNARVMANWFKQALKDDFRAHPFLKDYLVQHMGWTSAKNKIEASGPNGAPINIRNLDKLTDAELAEFERLAAKIAVDPES